MTLACVQVITGAARPITGNLSEEKYCQLWDDVTYCPIERAAGKSRYWITFVTEQPTPVVLHPELCLVEFGRVWRSYRRYPSCMPAIRDGTVRDISISVIGSPNWVNVREGKARFHLSLPPRCCVSATDSRRPTWKQTVESVSLRTYFA